MTSAAISEEEAQRRQAEEALRASEQRYRDLLDNSPVLTGIVSGAGQILYANAAFAGALEIDAWDLVGQNLLAFLDAAQGDALKELIAEAVREKQADGSICLSEEVGGQALLARVRVYEEDEDIPYLIFSAVDVSAQIELQQQLAQAQKLESIGQLSAGIAHEINTPTQYVGDNVRFLQEAFTDITPVLSGYGALLAACETGGDTAACAAAARKAVEDADLEFLNEEIPSALAHSIEGLERVSRIVRAMKSFSHPGTESRTNVNLNECIESTATVAANEWKYVADLDLELDPELPLASCSPGELNQVFLNMIVNAAHAIGDVVGDGAEGKGRIGIATARVGDDVEIRISDTGAGIPEEICQRIFDPFFTTKGVGKGTGQGLAIAHRVVSEDHGGTIEVSSEVGRGTEFRIRIPIGIGPQDDDSEVIG